MTKTWLDNIKEDLKATNMDVRAAAEVTLDRVKYNLIVSKPVG